MDGQRASKAVAAQPAQRKRRWGTEAKRWAAGRPLGSVWLTFWPEFFLMILILLHFCTVGICVGALVASGASVGEIRNLVLWLLMSMLSFCSTFLKVLLILLGQ